MLGLKFCPFSKNLNPKSPFLNISQKSPQKWTPHTLLPYFDTQHSTCDFFCFWSFCLQGGPKTTKKLYLKLNSTRACKKNFFIKATFFLGVPKVLWEGEQDPGPFFEETDPRIRISFSTNESEEPDSNQNETLLLWHTVLYYAHIIVIKFIYTNKQDLVCQRRFVRCTDKVNYRNSFAV